jgi:glutamyl-tRNA synthetase
LYNYLTEAIYIMSKIRTRFAPSPTGYLHIGGARTSLFSYLYARHFGGDFILRIEDTDTERSTEESIQAIMRAMEWLGLDFDEGPFRQTERLERYQEVLAQLLSEGKAYRCVCTKERLDQLREQQMASKEKPRYDGCCRDKTYEADIGAHVIRFRNPKEGKVVFKDLVRGEVAVANSELDDLIIARSNGMPTYNFTVVVDDADMQITHVIRGDDHINNTPRQINLLSAMGIAQPVYAHVPTILGEDGKRLSKRHGAVSVMQYQEEGILPQALLNYLVRLGWAHGDQEIFSSAEMIELFNLEKVNSAPACFSREKLLWLNQHYMKELDVAIVASALADQFELNAVDVSNGPALSAIIEMQAQRCKTLQDMVDRSLYFFQDFQQYDEKAARKNLTVATLPVFEALLEGFAAVSIWKQEALHQVVIDVAQQRDLKLGKVAQPLRVALTGGTVSPPIDQTLLYLGQASVSSRIQAAMDYIKQQSKVT